MIDRALFITLVELIISVCAIQFSKEILFGIIPYKKYVLFLRAFKEDEHLTIDKTLKQFFKCIVEIGDPKSKEGNVKFSGYTFFLSSNNWRKEVEYYISRANYVFCNIVNTEGVRWEIEAHIKHYHKYIFYIRNTSKLHDILDNKGDEKPIYNILQELIINIQDGPCAFIIRDHSVIFTRHLNKLLKCIKIKGDVTQFSSFKLDDQTYYSIISENSNKKMCFGYYIKDVFRYLWIIIRPRKIILYFSALLGSVVGVFVPIAIFLMFILAIGLIIYGIITLFSVFSVDNAEIGGVIIEGGLPIVFGVYILIELINGLKD